MTEHEERNWASYAHLMILLGVVIPFANVAAPIIVYLAKGGESRFVRFHAAQSAHLQLLDLTAILAMAGVGTALGLQFGWPLFVPFGLAILILSLITLIAPLFVGVSAKDGEWRGYPVLERWLPPSPEPEEDGMVPLEPAIDGRRTLALVYLGLVVAGGLGAGLAGRAYGVLEREQRRQEIEEERARQAIENPDVATLSPEALVQAVHDQKRWEWQAVMELERRGPEADAAISGALAAWPQPDGAPLRLMRALERRERLGPEYLPALRRRAEDTRFILSEPVALYCRIDPLPASETPVLLRLIASGRARREAIAALRRLPAEATQDLIEALQDPRSVRVRLGAAEGLGGPAHASGAAVAALRRAVADERADEGQLAVAAISGLGGMGPGARAAIPDLQALLSHYRLASYAREALQQMGPEGQAAARDAADAPRREADARARAEEEKKLARDQILKLARALNDPSSSTRVSAAMALGRMGPAAGPAAPSLIFVIQGGADLQLRMAAAEALGNIGPAAIGADLGRARKALQMEVEQVASESHRRIAREALEKLGGAPAPPETAPPGH